MSEREWVVHSLGLCRERVKKFNARHEPVDDPMAYFRRLKWELDWREYVWKMVCDGRVRELSPVAGIWWAYMQGHAALQVMRAEKTISEGEFHERARALRHDRDQQIKKKRVA